MYLKLIQNKLRSHLTLRAEHENKTSVTEYHYIAPTFANMAAGVLDCRVAVDIGQKAQAKAIFVVGRIGEPIHQHTSRGGMISLSNTVIQLIVHNRAPVAWLFILYRLHI